MSSSENHFQYGPRSNPIPEENGFVGGEEVGDGGAGITVFKMEYGHWVGKHNRQISELRTALATPTHMLDDDLRILVEDIMNHYGDLFRMKATAAKADVFFLMSGIWKTSAECFFSWIGGFRPSELLKVLVPQLDLILTEDQRSDIHHLKQSCLQAEDALSQGMQRLQHILGEVVGRGQLGEGSYFPQMSMEKLDFLVRFVNQADILRQETLQQMYHILNTQQAAQALLALGEYIQRLRDLSSRWSNRQCDPS